MLDTWRIPARVAAAAVALGAAIAPAAASGDAFTLSASPETIAVPQGGSVPVAVTVSPTGGFTGPVSLSATGVPDGVSATFSPSSTGGASTLVLTAAAGASVGSATVTISGTAGGITQRATVTVDVAEARTPDFALAVSPEGVTVLQGEARTVTVTVSPAGGFSGEVSLDTMGLPAGVSAAFSPPTTTGATRLTLTASPGAAAGTATAILTGSGGGLTRYAAVPLEVVAGSAASAAGGGAGGGAGPGGCASAGLGGPGGLALVALLALRLGGARRRTGVHAQ